LSATVPVVVPGEDEVFLDGQQELTPGVSAGLGADLERADAEGGSAAGVLGELFLAGGQALADQAAAFQSDAHVDEREREGQVLEVVGDVSAVAAARVEEVDVVDHAEPDITGKNSIGGLVAEFLGVALVMAGQAEEPAAHRVERPLAGG
jgi:hypothetical protein